MKIQKIHTAILCRLLCLMLLPLLATACLYEHPELTEDGEPGVDPTEVNVNIDLTLGLKMDEAAGTRLHTRAEAPAYCHRLIVDAYLDRQLAKRQVVYKKITDAEELSASINMKLHARNYQLVVWADYVEAESEEDLFYNTATLIPAVNSSSYKGNTEYKDVLYDSQPLNLSEYRNQWDAHVPVMMELKRPVARYELIADDLTKLLKKIDAGEVTGSRFTATVRYTHFFSTGFNALDGIAKNALQYIAYSSTFTAPAPSTGEDAETKKEQRVGLDYVFVPDGEAGIPIAVEITDANNNLIARTYLLLQCKAGRSQTIRSNFLTADPSGGIGFDPDYDGSIDEEIEVE